MKKDAQAEQAVNELEVKKRSQLSYIWFRFRKNKLAMVGMFLLLVMALICVTAPLYLDYNDDVVTQHVMEKFTKPFSEGHILGTDHYGRDMFARIVYGGRISLSMGFAIVALSLAIGIGFTSASETQIWSIFPQVIQDVFAANCVAVVFVMSIVLSLILPKNMEVRPQQGE